MKRARGFEDSGPGCLLSRRIRDPLGIHPSAVTGGGLGGSEGISR